MSKETQSGSADPLNTLRKIAEDPLASSVVTLFAAKVIAEEVVGREERARLDMKLSSGEMVGVRSLVESHPIFTNAKGADEFNTFLTTHEELALSRSVPTHTEVADPFIENILRPSGLSLWISRQERLPLRSQVANLLEDIKLSAVAPVVLARGLRKQLGSKIADATIFGLPVLTGFYVSMLPVAFQGGGSPNIVDGVLATAVLYMGSGYMLYRPGRKNVTPYRQELNNP